MSVSTRTQRATIYPYVGRNDTGYVSSTYGEARGEYWCRLSDVAGDVSMLDHQPEISARGVIEFGDDVPVAEHDLIVIDGVQWKAGPVTPRPAQRAKVLRVERSTKTMELPVGVAAAAPEEVFSESGHTDEAFDAPVDTSVDGGGAAAVFPDALDGGGA